MPEEAKNIAGIRKWIDENRPDLRGHFEQIVSGETASTSYCQAMLLLLTVGFEAGRAYQRENPNDADP